MRPQAIAQFSISRPAPAMSKRPASVAAVDVDSNETHDLECAVCLASIDSEAVALSCSEQHILRKSCWGATAEHIPAGVYGFGEEETECGCNELICPACREICDARPLTQLTEMASHPETTTHSA